MGKRVLVTSFATWRVDQRSNASDDLLVAAQQEGMPASVAWVRQLPVNLPIARDITLAKMNRLQSEVIICCGMAESRQKLTVERQATVRGQTLKTPIELEELIQGLHTVEISEDAGRFVCNSLYYAMLDYLSTHHPDRLCLFVHVPVLMPEHQSSLIADFRCIVDRLVRCNED